MSEELSEHEVGELADYQGDLAKLEGNPNLPDVSLELPFTVESLTADALQDDPRARFTELTKAQGARVLRLLIHQIQGEAKGRWQLPDDTVASLMGALARAVMVMIEWPGAPQKPADREANIAPEELSHILAALTFFRQARLGDAENRPPPIQRIATCGGTFPSLNDERIQLLIERLDGAQRIVVGPPSESHLGTTCSVCNEPQYASVAGPVCANGHGGAQPA